MDFKAIVETFQRVLMYLSLATLAALAVGSILYKTREFWDKVYHDWLHLDGFGKIVAAGAIIMATLYGGSKNAGYNRVAHEGADDGLQLCGVYVMLTNEVVSASTTNTWTEVRVEFTGSGITTSTPVAARMTSTNEWLILTKVNPAVITDLSTNILHFSVSNDVTRIPYWWVGEDRHAIDIETTGITLLSFVAGSHSVAISWECDNPKATSFKIEYRNGTSGEWTELTTTEATSITVSGFFINRTTQWRVTSTYTEGK